MDQLQKYLDFADLEPNSDNLLMMFKEIWSDKIAESNFKKVNNLIEEFLVISKVKGRIELTDLVEHIYNYVLSQFFIHEDTRKKVRANSGVFLKKATTAARSELMLFLIRYREDKLYSSKNLMKISEATSFVTKLACIIEGATIDISEETILRRYREYKQTVIISNGFLMSNYETPKVVEINGKKVKKFISEVTRP